MCRRSRLAAEREWTPETVQLAAGGVQYKTVDVGDVCDTLQTNNNPNCSPGLDKEGLCDNPCSVCSLSSVQLRPCQAGGRVAQPRGAPCEDVTMDEQQAHRQLKYCCGCTQGRSANTHAHPVQQPCQATARQPSAQHTPIHLPSNMCTNQAASSSPQRQLHTLIGLMDTFLQLCLTPATS